MRKLLIASIVVAFVLTVIINAMIKSTLCLSFFISIFMALVTYMAFLWVHDFVVILKTKKGDSDHA